MADRERRRSIVLLAWIGAGTLLVAGIVEVQLAYGLSGADDAWFLQVVDRVRGGDALYGEVQFGATPLAVWVALPPVAVFGAKLVVFKTLVSICAVASALVASRVAAQVGLGPAGQALVAVSSIAYLPLPGLDLYNPLSYLFLLLALSAVLAWQARLADTVPARQGLPLAAALVAAGVAAGLCFAAKQNVGLLALAALMGAVLWSSTGGRDLARRAKDMAVALGAFAVAVALPLIPVLLSGAFDDFAVSAFEKSRYVRYGSISFLDGLDSLAGFARDPFGQLRSLAEYAVFGLPLLAFAGLVAGWIRADRERALTLGLFAAAAFAGIFPRAEIYHLGFSVPALAIAVGWSASRIRPLIPRVAARGAVMALGCVLVLTAVDSLLVYPRQLVSDRGLSASALPNLEGTLVGQGFDDSALRVSEELRRADMGADRTFLLMPSAGLYYLLSGLENPTRFDYPTVTTFGRSGQDEVIDAIERDWIQRVCVGGYGGSTFGPLRPGMLVRHVRERMHLVRRIGNRDDVPGYDGGCSLYTTERRSAVSRSSLPSAAR